MRFEMVFTEEHRLPQTVGRCVQVAIFELSQPQVQEQIPISLSKRRSTLIFPDLRPSVADHSFGKTQMIVSECVVRMLAYDFGVKTNRRLVVFDAQCIVRADIADLLLAYPRACARAMTRESSKIAAPNVTNAILFWVLIFSCLLLVTIFRRSVTTIRRENSLHTFRENPRTVGRLAGKVSQKAQ